MYFRPLDRHSEKRIFRPRFRLQRLDIRADDQYRRQTVRRRAALEQRMGDRLPGESRLELHGGITRVCSLFLPDARGIYSTGADGHRAALPFRGESAHSIREIPVRTDVPGGDFCMPSGVIRTRYAFCPGRVTFPSRFADVFPFRTQLQPSGRASDIS